MTKEQSGNASVPLACTGPRDPPGLSFPMAAWPHPYPRAALQVPVALPPSFWTLWNSAVHYGALGEGYGAVGEGYGALGRAGLKLLAFLN